MSLERDPGNYVTRNDFQPKFCQKAFQLGDLCTFLYFAKKVFALRPESFCAYKVSFGENFRFLCLWHSGAISINEMDWVSPGGIRYRKCLIFVTDAKKDSVCVKKSGRCKFVHIECKKVPISFLGCYSMFFGVKCLSKKFVRIKKILMMCMISLEGSSNFDSYLKELGVNFILRQLAQVAQPTVTVDR